MEVHAKDKMLSTIKRKQPLGRYIPIDTIHLFGSYGAIEVFVL